MELHHNTDPGTSGPTNIYNTEKLDIPQTITGTSGTRNDDGVTPEY